MLSCILRCDNTMLHACQHQVTYLIGLVRVFRCAHVYVCVCVCAALYSSCNTHMPWAIISVIFPLILTGAEYVLP